MTLTLSIVNVDKLDNGVATRLRLDRHGAVIGRSPYVDWSLPDPRNYISSTHCEIDYRDGAYTLIDKSTNGTFVNGAQTRMPEPHRIADGDTILIGHYEVSARLEGEGQTAGAEPEAPAWKGWDSHGGEAAPPAAPPASSGWGSSPTAPAISGTGPLSQNWAPPRAEAPAASGSSVWSEPAPASTPASAWSSPVSDEARPASASDVWGKLAAGNDVDWGRGFGQPSPSADALGLTPAPAEDPLALQPSKTIAGPTAGGWGTAAAPAAPSAPAAPAPTPAPPAAPSTGGEWSAFLAASGLQASDVKVSPAEALGTAGAMIRRLVGGVVVMLEARARAKAQLGARGTALEFEGNNPLKFARTPEQALAQLLNPQQRGFMGPERAVEDSFHDLQAHQMATLAAMQGALRATLARFSPEAIRNRAETGGLLAKILPGSRNAALWQAYEKEFEGVARGSDEAFMDVFAKEFRQAYEQAAADLKRKG